MSGNVAARSASAEIGPFAEEPVDAAAALSDGPQPKVQCSTFKIRLVQSASFVVCDSQTAIELLVDQCLGCAVANHCKAEGILETA